MHAGLYFILFFLILRIFDKKYFKEICIASILCIVQGILIEIIQGSPLIEHRSFDVYDIVANVAGVIIGIILKKTIHSQNNTN